MAEPPLFQLSALTLDFPQLYGNIGLVRDVSLTIEAGECVGLVGESGSGKTLLGLSIMGLQPATARLSGSIKLRGRELINAPEKAWRPLRGRDLAMVYQDALVSLNPGMRIRAQLAQALRHGGRLSDAELLEAVQIRDVARCLHSYPHELSGGQRQRVLIALAIAGSPALIVADEPTTALDVTVQAQVIELLAGLRRELGFGLLFVSHDLGLVATVADRVVVMYAGDLVEMGATQDILGTPRHPYTAGLLEASRSLEEGRALLAPIPGAVPAPADFARACRFADRCSSADEVCVTERPRLTRAPADHTAAACHHPIGRTTTATSDTAFSEVI